MLYRVIAPDLRGHGESHKLPHGYHVSRLAMDLKNLIDDLQLARSPIRVIAGSLGCAIIWLVLTLQELWTIIILRG
jgi:pimeloyl-ACP methyl ester carboxylesterase